MKTRYLLPLFLLILSPPLVMAQGFDMEWITYGRTNTASFPDGVSSELGVQDVATEYNTLGTIGNTYVVGTFVNELKWDNIGQELETDLPITTTCGSRIGYCPSYPSQGFLSKFDPIGQNLFSIKFNSSDGRHTVAKSVALNETNGEVYVAGSFFGKLRITATGTAANTGSLHTYQYQTPNYYNNGATFIAKFDDQLNFIDIRILHNYQLEDHINIHEIRYDPRALAIYAVGSVTQRLWFDDQFGNLLPYSLTSVLSNGQGDVDAFVLDIDPTNLDARYGSILHSAGDDELTALDVVPHHTNGFRFAVGGYFEDALFLQEPVVLSTNLGLHSGSGIYNTYATDYTSVTGGGNDLVFAMLDEGTNFIWLNRLEGEPRQVDYVHNIACDATSSSTADIRIAITGKVWSPVTTLSSTGITPPTCSFNFTEDPFATLPFNTTPPIYNGTTNLNRCFGCVPAAPAQEAFLIVYDGNGNLVHDQFHETCDLSAFTQQYGSQGYAVDLVYDNSTGGGTRNPFLLNGGIYDGRVQTPSSGNNFDFVEPIGFVTRHDLTSSPTFVSNRSFPEAFVVPFSPLPPETDLKYGVSALTAPRTYGNTSTPSSYRKVNDYFRVGGFASTRDFELQRSLSSVNPASNVVYENLAVVPYQTQLVGFSYFIGVFGVSGGNGNAENFKHSHRAATEDNLLWVNSNESISAFYPDFIIESSRVIDALGRTIRSFGPISVVSLDKAELPIGIYTIMMKVGGNTITRKFEVLR